MNYQLKIISFLLLSGLFFCNCGPTGFNTVYDSIYSFTPVPGVIGGNIVPLSVGLAYMNSLTATITVCAPAQTGCATVGPLLVDTGSVGLRVQKSALPAAVQALNPDLDPYSNQIANCVVYGDATYHWGAVVTASVQLGSEAAVSIPIQVIDYTYGDSGAGCRAAAGQIVTQDTFTSGKYVGIIGIKLFKEDCGVSCVTNGSGTNPSYFGCNGATCGSITLSLGRQMKNPIASLSGDNNGYSIDLPAVASTGGKNVTGSLILGIESQSNNKPSSTVTRLPVNPSGGTLTGTFNGSAATVIIDSGSNANYFQHTGLSVCTANTSFYCPGGGTSFIQQTLAVLLKPGITTSGNPSISSQFYVGDYTMLLNTTSCTGGLYCNSFNNLSGTVAGLSSYLDLGLSYFFGKKIYYGIEGRPTSLGDGPYIGF